MPLLHASRSQSFPPPGDLEEDIILNSRGTCRQMSALCKTASPKIEKGPDNQLTRANLKHSASAKARPNGLLI